MKGGAKARNIIVQMATYFTLITVSLSILYVIAIIVVSAFRPGNLVAFSLDFNIQWSLQNFKKLFTEELFGRWYVNTLIIAVMAMALQITIVTLGGYAFSRFRFVGRKQSMKFFLIAQMIPVNAAFTAFYVLALLVNGFDQYWFIVIIFVGMYIPMNMYLMKGYFDTVSISLDEAARIDGASRMRTLVQIVLPLVRPMIAIQALLAFMAPFMEYMLPSLILRASSARTLAVGLQVFIYEPRMQKVALFAAGSLLASLPIVVLFFFLQKNFISGLTSGGAKG
ncbi:MAG: sugar ABC transporter permease [Oscillospiraceae bacterium]|nr:sugar ABC transporter permease [Oscillospiraceae bacterium]